MIATLDKEIYHVRKNRRDMDLENARVEGDIDKACDAMVAVLEGIQGTLRSIRFE